MTSVLVVDDDTKFGAALARELADNGYDVRVATNVDEALGEVATHPPDVLLTDLRMSEKDGIDLLEQVRTVSRSTRSVLMSAFATARDHQTAMDLGAVRVLCKPFTSSELLQAMRQAVECETGFRGSVHGLSLIDLLQMFHYSRRSITVHVTGVERGAIYVREGELVHACHGESRGQEALRSLLARPSGSIHTTPYERVDPSIERSFQSLLLDLLRQLDEDPNDGSVDDALELAFSDHEPDAEHGPSDPRIATLRSGMHRIAPESAASIIDPERRSATTLHGEMSVTDDMLEAVNALRDEVASLDPEWTRYEHVRGAVALGLIRCVDTGCVVLLTDILVGRYASVKFRAKLGRLAELVQ